MQKQTKEQWLRSRLDGLRSQRKTSYTVNGEAFFQLTDKDGKARAVKLARLEGWIKDAEIELGLYLGRRTERMEEARRMHNENRPL